MARIASFFCLQAWLSTAFGERLAAEEEFDWRKVAMLSAVGAHTLAGQSQMVAGQQAEAGGLEGLGDNFLDSYFLFEAELVNNLRIMRGAPPDDSTIEALSKDLQKNRQVGTLVVDAIALSLLKHGIRPAMLPVDLLRSHDGTSSPAFDTKFVEVYSISDGYGKGEVLLVRFLAHEARSPEQAAALKQLLRRLRQASSTAGPFLRVYAQSHSTSKIPNKEGSEVMVLLEPVSGTLEQYLMLDEMSPEQSLVLFSSVMLGVDELCRKRIAHSSDISPKSILVTGDAGPIQDVGVVFSPSLFNTGLKVSTRKGNVWRKVTKRDLPEDTVNPGDLLAKDIVMLGRLLETMLSSMTSLGRKARESLDNLAVDMMRGKFEDIRGRSGVLSKLVEVLFAPGGVMSDDETWEALKMEAPHSAQATIAALTSVRRAAHSRSPDKSEVQVDEDSTEADDWVEPVEEKPPVATKHDLSEKIQMDDDEEEEDIAETDAFDEDDSIMPAQDDQSEPVQKDDDDAEQGEEEFAQVHISEDGEVVMPEEQDEFEPVETFEEEEDEEEAEDLAEVDTLEDNDGVIPTPDDNEPVQEEYDEDIDAAAQGDESEPLQAAGKKEQGDNSGWDPYDGGWQEQQKREQDQLMHDQMVHGDPGGHYNDGQDFGVDGGGVYY